MIRITVGKSKAAVPDQTVAHVIGPTNVGRFYVKDKNGKLLTDHFGLAAIFVNPAEAQAAADRLNAAEAKP